MSFVCDPCKKNKQVAKSFYAITIDIMTSAQMMFFSYTFLLMLQTPLHTYWEGCSKLLMLKKIWLWGQLQLRSRWIRQMHKKI
jgi:hypothetical protein